MIIHVFGDFDKCQWSQKAVAYAKRKGFSGQLIKTDVSRETGLREMIAFLDIFDVRECNGIPQIFVVDGQGTKSVGDYDEFVNYLEEIRP